MKNQIARFFLVASLSTMANNIVAQESGIDWVAGFAIGAKTIEFEEHRDGVVVESIDSNAEGSIFDNDRDYEETLYYADLSLGAAIQNFYIAANVEVPIVDTEYDQSLVGTQTEARIPNVDTTDSGDLSRFDYALTLGYNIWEGLSVFTGYKFGETELDADVGANSNVPQNFETSYEEKGYFAGASYAFNIADAGTLSLSIAYANLDAEYSESGDFGTPSSPTNTQEALADDVFYDGDADGFSYGIKWTGRLADSLQYNIGLKYQKYELDGKGGRGTFTNTNVTGEPTAFFNTVALEIETTEEITTLSAGLAYIF